MNIVVICRAMSTPVLRPCPMTKMMTAGPFALIVMTTILNTPITARKLRYQRTLVVSAVSLTALPGIPSMSALEISIRKKWISLLCRLHWVWSWPVITTASLRSHVPRVMVGVTPMTGIWVLIKEKLWHGGMTDGPSSFLKIPLSRSPAQRNDWP